jgi:hypothetical protein
VPEGSREQRLAGSQVWLRAVAMPCCHAETLADSCRCANPIARRGEHLSEDDSHEPVARAADIGEPPVIPSAELRPALMRFFQRSGIPAAETDDLVQDVFLRMIRRVREDIENIVGYSTPSQAVF